MNEIWQCCNQHVAIYENGINNTVNKYLSNAKLSIAIFLAEGKGGVQVG
jgi:hypothetical protein